MGGKDWKNEVPSRDQRRKRERNGEAEEDGGEMNGLVERDKGEREE